MQAMLRFIPGFAAASVAFVVTRLFSWTEVGFEFSVFLAAYAAVAISLDRGLKRYGVANR
jgi:hypothetical protein